MVIDDPEGLLGTRQYTAATANKVAYVNLVKADLKIYNGGNNGTAGAQVPDADEESVGSYLLVNWDDDNDNDMPDLDESSTGANEDDLAKLELDIAVCSNTGTIQLVKTGGNVKIWSSPNKQTEVTDLSWDLATETPPIELWIEGRAASGSERDVTFQLKYNGQLYDTVKATVVMINLGNAVYRQKQGGGFFGHGGLVTAYLGACSHVELNDATNFQITHMQESGVEQADLSNITNNGSLTVFGCYTNTSISYSDRLNILETVNAIYSRNNPPVGYVLMAVLDPDNWTDTVNGINNLRCDGLIEVCYEIHDINVWGKLVGGSTHYNIKNDVYQAEHDDIRDPLDKGLIPSTQCGYSSIPYEGVEWNTTFDFQNLCIPVGHSGGN